MCQVWLDLLTFSAYIEFIYQLHFLQKIRKNVHFLRNFRKKCNFVKSVMVDELTVRMLKGILSINRSKISKARWEKYFCPLFLVHQSLPQREFFGHRHRRIEWGAPMRPLKRAFPCYFFFYLFRDKRHLLQKQKCILKCHMRDRNPLQCQIKTWVAVSSWGQQNVGRVAK